MALAALALPAISGTLGAIEGAKRGGLGGAILGGTAGALTPAGLRLAGTALGGIPALAGLAQKGTMLGRGALGLSGPVQAGSKLVAGAIPALGLAFGAPQLAGGLAGGLARPLGQGAGNVAQTGAGIIGYTRQGEPVYGGEPYDRSIGSMGGVTPEGLPLDVLGAPGMGRRLEQYKSGETQRDIMRMLLPEVYKATEATKKQDFSRQAAMKGIAQNIATRAAMLQNAQLAGLNMGQTAAQQAGSALTSQYQYQ
jgi:hypothetical protein